MTTEQYEEEMASINREIQAKVAPIQERINELAEQRSDIKKQIARLKIKEMEISSQHLNYCDEVRRIKASYNDRKTALYLLRPIVINNKEEKL